MTPPPSEKGTCLNKSRVEDRGGAELRVQGKRDYMEVDILRSLGVAGLIAAFFLSSTAGSHQGCLQKPLLEARDANYG